MAGKNSAPRAGKVAAKAARRHVASGAQRSAWPRTGRLGWASIAVAALLAVAASICSPDVLARLQEAALRAARAAHILGPSVDRARGYFPPGCRWREARRREALALWAIRRYEYWDEGAGAWIDEQPEACRLPIPPAPIGWVGSNASRTSYSCNGEHYCMYENVWYNQGQLYLLHDGDSPTEVFPMTKDLDLTPLHFKDTRAFSSQMDVRLAPGATLMLDFVFFLHPTAIGHWHEHLAPLLSVLRLEPTFAAPPSRILMLHLKRVHIFEWVRAVLAAAVGAVPGGNLPPMYFQEEVNSVWDQIGTRLEGVPPSAWVCFERVLVLKDTFTGGGRVAFGQEDMQLYRRRVYELHGLDPPVAAGAAFAPGSGSDPALPPALPPPPRTITFLRKSADRRVINEAAMLRMLREFGDVRVLEFGAATPMVSQLQTMASTGVLVSVHTSALANAVFLRPGSAVVELIHYNWIWYTLDMSFKVQTEVVGDVHHFAWRARRPEHVAYINPRDQARFGGPEWAAENCDTDECVEGHTKVDVVVDVAELRALLKDRLPQVWAGAAVADAQLAWPGWET